jgi:signal transduction histidine kinase
VQQFRAAGLDVAYDTAGDAAALPAAARTGLYRIVQESLANIAKNEPRARATVELDLSTDPARLAVRNTLTRQAPVNTDGRGLHGMSERASSLGGTLTAGPDGKDWQVLLELPNPHAHSCALPKLRDMVRPAPETA